ncbi:MAG: hypothetical protein AAF228_05395 [Pseudomonadota bacterium]
MRVYLDESGICHKFQRTHGYAPAGQRVHGLIDGKRERSSNR